MLGDDWIEGFQRGDADRREGTGDPVDKGLRGLLRTQPPTKFDVLATEMDLQNDLSGRSAVHICEGVGVLGLAEILAPLAAFRRAVEEPLDSLGEASLTVAVWPVEQDQILVEVDRLGRGAEAAEVTDGQSFQPHWPAPVTLVP